MQCLLHQAQALLPLMKQGRAGAREEGLGVREIHLGLTWPLQDGASTWEEPYHEEVSEGQHLPPAHCSAPQSHSVPAEPLAPSRNPPIFRSSPQALGACTLEGSGAGLRGSQVQPLYFQFEEHMVVLSINN